MTPLGDFLLHVLVFLILYRILSALLSAGYYLVLRVFKKPKEDAISKAHAFYDSVQFI